MRIRLTYPKSHSVDDLRQLYKDFQIERPEVFKKWKLLEENWRDGNESDLPPISNEIHNFLKLHTDWDSLDAIISATLDFRRLMWADISENRGIS